MPTTMTLLPDKEWLTTAEAAQLLGRNERTIQEMGHDGRLRTKLAGRTDRPKAKLYDLRDVRKYLPSEPKPAPSPASVRRREAERRKKERGPAPDGKLGHALETVTIVGQMIAAQKAELESRRAELSALTGQLTEFVKGEREAECQRQKFDREDARERWEAEQKRLAREGEEREAERFRAEERARPWLTLAQAEREFGLPAAALRQAVKEGRLTATRPGGLRIQRASLAAFAG